MWQDLSQLKQLYPADWETILNNSAVIQVFGLTNGWAAKSLGEIMDMGAGELLKMGTKSRRCCGRGKEPRITGRVDYLTDGVFAGLFDANPRYRRVVGEDGTRARCAPPLNNLPPIVEGLVNSDGRGSEGVVDGEAEGVGIGPLLAGGDFAVFADDDCAVGE